MNEVLRDTQLAFDSVATEYDGSLGNNDLIQRIRSRTINAVRQNTLPSNHFLDLGCGTGLDAEFLARAGYRVTAVDWSPQMTERTRDRIAHADLDGKVDVRNLGLHQLDVFQPDLFDAVYSDLGPLNCATDISMVAASLHRIMKRAEN